MSQLQRQVFTTPSQYLNSLQYFERLLVETQKNIQIQKGKLLSGLKKIQDTFEQIKGLKEKLLGLQPVLQEKNFYLKDLLQKLTQDQLQANMVKKVVQQEASELNIQGERILILKGEADQIYKDALPMLQGAMDQLDKLSRGDIGEIKQNNNPHPLVRFAAECIAIFLEEKPDWENIKKNVLSDAGLLMKLKSLKLESMTPATRKNIQQKRPF